MSMNVATSGFSKTAAPSLARLNTLSTSLSNLSSLLQSTLNRVSASALLDFSRAFSTNKNFVSSDAPLRQYL